MVIGNRVISGEIMFISWHLFISYIENIEIKIIFIKYVYLYCNIYIYIYIYIQ